ncbi:MAG: efflux RND transporter periplasmic adaptor subunit, partial [Proteobacteria bacterium]|nr:efflux RND transporter periplasmic adaptor subunit [Pseudomonadota bacterium]
LERTRIRAPFDGAVGQRMVSPGDRVTPDDGLVEILAIDRLQLLFAVPEVGVPLAREGIPVFIRVVAWPGEIFPGEVFFVSPNLEVGSRRLILKAWVANEAHRLKPGMFANVDVEIGRKEEALLVPEAAVVYDRNGVYLWRRGEENRAEKIPVEIGIRSEGKVEILSGIAPGDSVVSAGIHKVKAGTVLQIQEPEPATATPIHASDGGGAEGGAGGDAS